MMVYIHIPFCLSKCAYCDFNSYAGEEAQIPAYLAALEREMDACTVAVHREPVSSVYFGGGTPSLLSPGQIGDLLGAVSARFGLSPGAEVTVEINPATWNALDMRQAVNLGVTRLSLGAQSLCDDTLLLLGRPHGGDAARAALRGALDSRARSLSVDLIYGVPGQSRRAWLADLCEIAEMGIPHISAYALTLEDNTPLAKRAAAGTLVPAEESEIARMYLDACAELKERGYEHYEISNFARPGHASRHNLGYWERRPYLGLGAGAHSFDGRTRRWAPPGLSDYIEAAVNGTIDYGSESLDDPAVRNEEIMLGLRTSRGLPAGASGMDARTSRAWAEEGWVSQEDGRIHLTDEGMLVSNELISSLLARL